MPARRLLALTFLSWLTAKSTSSVLPNGYPCEFFGATNTPRNSTMPCVRLPDCKASKSQRYRSSDGSCNNLEVDTTWGMTGSKFERMVKIKPLMKFDYPQTFRPVGSPHKLPNARKVSSLIHSGKDQKSRNVTLMVMQLGQFLDHDLTLTPEINLCSQECPSVEEFNCCDFIGKDEKPNACMPIEIPDEDFFFNGQKPRKPRCLDFKRSQPFVCKNATDAKEYTGEQFNVLTSFVDASSVYGSTEERARFLRTFKDGLLKIQPQGLLPVEESECSQNENQEFQHQFVAGDDRVNENPGLQSLHTLWVKEHNRIAALFKKKNPYLRDEELYQEARRMVVAEWQNIVYREMLPVTLGPDLMEKFDLDVSKESTYRPNLSPNVFNAFATAAFRFGHSLIDESIGMMNQTFNWRFETLSDHFFNTKLMRNGQMETMLLGMCMQGAKKSNRLINDQVRNLLFKREGHTFGEDLAARNIQRGRDHELGSYDSYRQACGLSPLPGSFYNIPPNEIEIKVWMKFRRLYRKPSDIELFPGGMAETPMAGGLVGPTFGCIIGEQFKRLKLGDRYFFTHMNVHRNIRFCQNDLDLIRQRSLKDVLCDNTDLEQLPPSVLAYHIGQSQMVKCGEKFEPSPMRIAEPNDFDNFVEDSELEHGPNVHVAVVAGGFDGAKILSSVETYAYSGKCQHKLEDLPEPTYGLILLYSSGLLLACGGRTPYGSVGRRCWRYERNSGKGSWIEDPYIQMQENRWLGSGVHLPDDGRFFVTGGRFSPKTSEYFDPETRYWKSGPSLLASWERHCSLVAKNKLLLIGGSFNPNRVDELDLGKEPLEWIQRQNLLSYRRKPLCFLLPDNDTVLELGGSLFSTLYKISSGKSSLGPNSILNRSYGCAISLNGHLLVIGGVSFSTLVEEYDIQKMMFRHLDVRLKEPRTWCGATTVPAKFFQHLPGGCTP